MPSADHTQDWNNYWQGRSATQTGNALLGVGIENNEILSAFWQDVFKDKLVDTKIIDFACGAGSVLMQAKTAGLSDLTGLDVSENAIDVLKTKMPSVKGHVGFVDKTPYDSESYDMVVSQFGVEYAGSSDNILDAINEMIRILRPGGQIVLVAHIQGGAIASGCQRSLEQISLVNQSGFLKSAKEAFKAISKSQLNAAQVDKDRAVKTMKALNVTAEPIMAWLKELGPSKQEFARFTYHLLESTHKLMTNIQKYELDECLEWLEGMQSEILAYKGRMSSMIEAALSEKFVAQISDELSNAGLRVNKAEKMYFLADNPPAAWIIRGFHDVL